MEDNGVPQVRTRTCHRAGCTETLSYTPGVTRITEAFAIELGSWLTVMGENVQPVMAEDRVIGFQVVPDLRTFCSTECLKSYIDGLIQEYKDAEDRAVTKMKQDADKPNLEKLRELAGIK